MTWLFIATIFVMVVSPGPSFVVLVNETLRFGRVAGLVTIVGSSTGLLMWALASMLGLVVVLKTSEPVFVTFKLVGAAYLCYLAAMAVRTPKPLAPGGSVGAAEGAVPVSAPLWHSYRSGLVTSAANPKMATVYLALIPQFLPAGGGTFGDIAMLTAVQIVMSAGWYVVVVLVAEGARRLLVRPRVRVVLSWVSGGVLLLLGIRMAFMSNPLA